MNQFDVYEIPLNLWLFINPFLGVMLIPINNMLPAYQFYYSFISNMYGN